MTAESSAITDIHAYMADLGRHARAASRLLARAGTNEKNNALLAIARDLEDSAESLMAENAKDLDAGRVKGLEPALLDRLELTPGRIEGMVEGLRQIAALPDPIGAITDLNYLV